MASNSLTRTESDLRIIFNTGKIMIVCKLILA